MDAYTRALRAVMNPEQRFVIPTFQRDYEWTKDGQWKLLFEDLEAVADRLGSARTQAVTSDVPAATTEAKVAPHFLGAVVCDQLPHPVGGLGLWAVIDGQQRITTLQLLIRGVLDVLVEQGSSRVSQVRKMLENPDDMVSEPHEKHKLWPRRGDRMVWPVAMTDELAPVIKDEHLYLQARRYFAEQARRAVGAMVSGSASTPAGAGVEDDVPQEVSVDTVLAPTAEESTESRLNDLVDALLELFRVVVIELGPNDDAQVIFEVLNGRQTALSASDLVKNLLFLRGELADEAHLEQLYDQYWAPFDDSWWKAQVGTGHAARGRRDVLLSVWLTAVSGQEASVGHLYGGVRDYLTRTSRKTEDVLEELHRYGQAYAAIYQRPGSALESQLLGVSYGRMNLLNVTTVVPLLAWLRTLPPERLLLADHERAVAAVESWVVRRMLLGINTRGYGQAFLAVLKQAQMAAVKTPAEVTDAVVEALAAAPNKLVWPTDEQVAAAFATDNFYRFTRARIQMVLGALDTHLRASDPHAPPATFDYERLQIEHVMPQSWSLHWSLPGPAAGDSTAEAVARTERIAAVQRIGNLTLVTATFNQDVSNLGWAVKRPEFAQQPLKISAMLGEQSEWDEERIAGRGQLLADTACHVWPGPSVWAR